MKRFIVTVSCLALLGLAGCNIQTYENEQTYTLDATGLESLVIHHDEGQVDITGVDDTNEVTVIAKFVAESEDELLAQQFLEEKMEASLTKEGTTGQLETYINYDVGKEQGHLDLKIEMPSHLLLDFRQNEGPLTIRSMKADMKINHGTKSIILDEIIGNVAIVDGSGGLTLNNVSGDITINKNAGKTEMTETEGELTIIAGSGDIHIDKQTGNVTLRSGSGNVNVDHVDGDVTVLANRSGTLQIANVTGKITEPEALPES